MIGEFELVSRNWYNLSIIAYNGDEPAEIDKTSLKGPRKNKNIKFNLTLNRIVSDGQTKLKYSTPPLNKELLL